MKKPVTFDARITKARKPHKCYACECDIPAGQVYIAYPGTSYEGKFQTVHLCIECSFLLTQKDGADARTIEQGNFTERRIPNWMTAHYHARNLMPKTHCSVCGSQQNLDIHHIDRNWRNNSLDNLICLCRSCHVKTHRTNTPL